MNSKLPRGTLDRLWADPKNWNEDGNYFCPEDPRWIVPSRLRRKSEWHYNEAHQKDFPFLVRRAPVIIVCVVAVLGAGVDGYFNPTGWLSYAVVPAAILCCHMISWEFRRRMASTARFEA